MEVHNNELRTTRELAREVNSILDALSARDVDKVVVTQGGKFKAVIITPDHYDNLCQAAADGVDVN